MKNVLVSLRKGLFPLFLLVMFACRNNDDAAPPTTTYLLEIEVHQFELVLLSLEAGSLDAATYQGFINDESIELMAVGDSVLVADIGFIDPGVYDLDIPELNDASIKLTILETVLEDTPSAIVESIIDEIETVIGTDNTRINAAITTMTTVFENASDEEKYLMAATWQANRELFETILLSALDETEGGRSSEFCATDVCKFKASVLAMGAGVVLISTVSPVAAVVGVTMVIIGYDKAVEYHEAYMDVKLKIIDMSINEIIGGERTSGDTQFIVNQPYIISLSAIKRTLNNTDEESTNEFIALFFDYRSILEKTIEKANDIIELINEEVPFADFDLLDYPVMPTTSVNGTEEISSSNFGNYSFSIPEGGITAAVSLHAAGKIKLTVSANSNVDLSNPIETSLAIGYQDDYNDEQTTFPITIAEEIITNYFSYDNVSYSLAKCFLDNDEEFDEADVNHVNAVITSDGISFSDELVGIGDAIQIYFNVSKLSGIENGTYSYSTMDTQAFTFTDSRLYINIDAQQVDDEEAIAIIGGTIIVSNKTASQVTLDFELVMSGNKTLKGNYSGTFQNVYF